jgi:hypothetical protein
MVMLWAAQCRNFVNDLAVRMRPLEFFDPSRRLAVDFRKVALIFQLFIVDATLGHQVQTLSEGDNVLVS